jgi:hypothetical protein
LLAEGIIVPLALAAAVPPELLEELVALPTGVTWIEKAGRVAVLVPSSAAITILW